MFLSLFTHALPINISFALILLYKHLLSILFTPLVNCQLLHQHLPSSPLFSASLLLTIYLNPSLSPFIPVISIPALSDFPISNFLFPSLLPYFFSLPMSPYSITTSSHFSPFISPLTQLPLSSPPPHTSFLSNIESSFSIIPFLFSHSLGNHILPFLPFATLFLCPIKKDLAGSEVAI